MTEPAKHRLGFAARRVEMINHKLLRLEEAFLAIEAQRPGAVLTIAEIVAVIRAQRATLRPKD